MSIYLGNKKISHALKIGNTKLLKILEGTATDIKASDWKGITKIGDYLFYRNKNLQSIEIPEGVTSIGSNSFYDLTNNLKLKIPSSLESIGSHAFYYTNVTNFNPDFSNCLNLTSIGANAFEYTYIKGDVILPDSVKSIGASAFKTASTNYITSYSIGDNLIEVGHFVPVNLGNIYENGYYYGSRTNPYFIYASPVDKTQTSYIIHKDCKVLARQCFYANKKVTDIIFEEGSSLERLNYECLHQTDNLINLELPQTVKYYSDRCLLNNPGIKKIHIDTNINFEDMRTYGNLGRQAFSGCPNVTEIYFNCPQWPGSVYPNADNYWFDNCGKNSGGIKLTLGPDMITLPGLLFTEDQHTSCANISEIDFGPSLTTIEARALWGLKNLKELNIPSTIKILGGYAFAYNGGLTSLTLPNTIEEMGSYCFSNSADLESLIIEDNFKSLGYGAFSDCPKLSSVTIGEGLETLGGIAFWHATALAEITLPSTILTIGNQAFEGCTALQELTVKASNPPNLIGSALNRTDIQRIYIPTGTLEAYSTATNWTNYADKFIETDF